MLAHRVEVFQSADLRQHRLGRQRLPPLDGQDHLVLAGVLQADEFEHLGVVAVRLEQQGAQRVGEHLGLLAEVDAVLQHRGQQRRALQLRPDLFVATRRADDQGSARADAQVDGMVGGGVAGVQRNHDICRRRRALVQVAEFELQAGQAQPFGCAIAQLHQVGPQLDAGDVGLAAQGVSQVMVHREREIALAAAEVGDLNARLGLQRRGQHGMVEDLDELVDLLELARHRRHQLAVGRCHP